MWLISRIISAIRNRPHAVFVRQAYKDAFGDDWQQPTNNTKERIDE